MNSTRSSTAESQHDRTGENRPALAKKVAGVAWGLFLVWMGVAFLANVGWGVGLLGVGVITLGAQVARKYFGLPVEQFWLVMGIAFVVSGVWKSLNVHLGQAPIPGSPVPILFIAVGVVVIVSALLRKPRH